jgi:hypothetical protein
MSIEHIRYFYKEYDDISDDTLRNALLEKDLKIDNAVRFLNNEEDIEEES